MKLGQNQKQKLGVLRISKLFLLLIFDIVSTEIIQIEHIKGKKKMGPFLKFHPLLSKGAVCQHCKTIIRMIIR